MTVADAKGNISVSKSLNIKLFKTYPLENKFISQNGPKIPSTIPIDTGM